MLTRIARLEMQDNENDEYHVKVSVVDVCAEYARLRDGISAFKCGYRSVVTDLKSDTNVGFEKRILVRICKFQFTF